MKTMYKLIIVHLFLSSVLLVNSLFEGESCFVEDQSGICSLLTECQPIRAEIERAGNSMSQTMSKRLHALTCGFILKEPLVCCPPSDTKPSNNESPGTRDVDVSQVPSRKPVQSDNSNAGGSNKIVDSSEKIRYQQNNSQNKPNASESKQEDESSEIVINDGIPDVRKHRNLRLLPTNCGLTENDRIFGGNRTGLFELPWMILISHFSGRGTFFNCGGTLISERYVLTAAHCVTYLGPNLKLGTIFLGENDITQDPDCFQGYCAPNVMNVTIEKVIVHSNYSHQTKLNDIALIRLSEPANFSLDSMKPICLPTTPQLQRELLVGYKGVVAGWGATEKGYSSPVLLQVELAIISYSDCKTAYLGTPFEVQLRHMCAGGLKDKDSCVGDSGGPIFYPGLTGVGFRYVQRGIVSSGTNRCGLEGFPGVYTNIAYYMDWILDNMSN